MEHYFSALFTAILYGAGVLVGMCVLSTTLVAAGGGTKRPNPSSDDGHGDHGHAHGSHAAPAPSVAAEARPAAEVLQEPPEAAQAPVEKAREASPAGSAASEESTSE